MRMNIGFSIALTAVLVAGSGWAPSPQGSLQDNKRLVALFTDATNAADWETLADIVADDFVRHSAASGGPEVTSREQFVELQESFLETFPDQRVTLRRVVAEGSHVTILATYSATQSGPMGEFPATGKEASIPFLAMFRIEDDRIVELWIEWDNVAMLTQLGHFPPQ